MKIDGYEMIADGLAAVVDKITEADETPITAIKAEYLRDALLMLVSQIGIIEAEQRREEMEQWCS